MIYHSIYSKIEVEERLREYLAVWMMEGEVGALTCPGRARTLVHVLQDPGDVGGAVPVLGAAVVDRVEPRHLGISGGG